LLFDAGIEGGDTPLIDGACATVQPDGIVTLTGFESWVPPLAKLALTEYV
jgi:hypothetical protein